MYYNDQNGIVTNANHVEYRSKSIFVKIEFSN